MTLIPAQPGWRAFVWVREHDGAYPLEIVTWELRTRAGTGPRIWLEPYIATGEGGALPVPLTDFSGGWFVALVPPGTDIDEDWYEQARDVAEAERDAEEREERERAAG